MSEEIEKTRFWKCRHSIPDLDRNNPGKIKPMCRKHGLDKLQPIKKSDCDTCPDFKSREIEFPITIENIELKPFEVGRQKDIGRPVKIQICQEDGKVSKSYDGIFIGEQSIGPHVSYYENTKTIVVQQFPNPMIYVPELKKTVCGCESWWTFADHPKQD